MARRLTHVSVDKGAGHNLMTPEEFASLPISERITLMMQHKAVFLDEAGQPMPPLDAIEQLPTPKPKTRP